MKKIAYLIIPLCFLFSCIEVYNDLEVINDGKDSTVFVRDTVTIVIPAPKDSAVIAPLIGATIQPTCAILTGSVLFSSLPKTGNWTLTRYPGGIVTPGSGISLTLSDIPPGTYNYTVTNSSGRTSPVSANLVISNPPLSPSAPSIGAVTQPTCSESTGSIVLTGLPSEGTWILNPGNISGVGTSKTLSGLISGNYSYSILSSSGCSSPVSEVVTIKTQPSTPSAPVVGKITQPTWTVKTGSVVLSGLPDGNWTLTRTPGKVLIAGTGSSYTVTGLSPTGGAKCQSTTYTFTVTNEGGCISPPSNNVVITEYH